MNYYPPYRFRLSRLLTQQLARISATIIVALFAALWAWCADFHGAAARDERVGVAVAKVVDGDTVRVWYQGKKRLVRLIGIDAPEKKRDDHARQQSKRTDHKLSEVISAGLDAKAKLETLLTQGERIQLEFDREREDVYGRLLAYIYDNRGEFINERMVRDGYALTLVHKPNTRYANRFRTAQREAKEQQRGIWSDTKKFTAR